MHILQFGASCGVGLATAKLLVKDGHDVTAFLRRPDELVDGPVMTKIKGDAMDEQSVMDAFNHVGEKLDLVVFSIGAKPTTKQVFQLLLHTNTEPICVTQRGIQNVLSALHAHQVAYGRQPRLIVVSSRGLGEAAHARLSCGMKPVYSWLLDQPHKDKEMLEFLIYRAAGLTHADAGIQERGVAKDIKIKGNPTAGWLHDWIVVQPAFFAMNDDAKGGYRTGEELDGGSFISRGDLAVFIAEECVPKESTWKNKSVEVVY
ncbi:hypothetical protein HKX48_008723 [Thoreauomyces humboldtii]|nr:hypothetical protein HKX48_008723 [Thoreauomyces humboldtii]